MYSANLADYNIYVIIVSKMIFNIYNSARFVFIHLFVLIDLLTVIALVVLGQSY